jgi:hypothetical protein
VGRRGEGRSEAVWLDVGKSASMTRRNIHVPLPQTRVETRVTARTTVHGDVPGRCAIAGPWHVKGDRHELFGPPTHPGRPGSVSGAPNLRAGFTCEGEKVRAGIHAQG